MPITNRKTSLLLSVLLVAPLAGCSASSDTRSDTAQPASTESPAPAAVSPAATPTALTPPTGATASVPSAPPIAGVASSPQAVPQTISPGTPPAAVGSAVPSPAPSRAASATQITSGANDFYLFTSVRGALVNDPEMKGANVIVEVRDGSVTLSGTIADPKQKERAEQIARGVQGVKTVRNSLRLAAE